MQKRIMIIDDEPDTLLLVKAILEPEGFKVDDFQTSQEGLDALTKGSLPDLVLLDMRMPEISGPDFCDIVFKDKKFEKLKIVFFTASSDLDHSLAKKHKALGFIFKPFENNDFLKKVNEYLRM